MSTIFYDDVQLSCNQYAGLKKVINVSHEAPWIIRSIDGLRASRTAKLCGIYDNDSLASFAWYMPRSWQRNGLCFVGLSIGILTTNPSYRNKGHARRLIKEIEKMAVERNADFLYLAGIRGFYDKFGFNGFAPKSKLTFNRFDLPRAEGRIVSMNLNHLEAIEKLHSEYCMAISSFSSRSIEVWKDLLGPLSSTFLFNCPKVVIDTKSRPIAYYCSTPGESGTIREFVPLLDSDSVIAALSAIACSVEHRGNERIEIFSPATGPVWDVAKKKTGADFMCFLRPSSSNMIKWISKTKSFDDFKCEFILQGDAL